MGSRYNFWFSVRLFPGGLDIRVGHLNKDLSSTTWESITSPLKVQIGLKDNKMQPHSLSKLGRLSFPVLGRRDSRFLGIGIQGLSPVPLATQVALAITVGLRQKLAVGLPNL